MIMREFLSDLNVFWNIFSARKSDSQTTGMFEPRTIHTRESSSRQKGEEIVQSRKANGAGKFWDGEIGENILYKV